ncbi:Matrix metalloproteinase-17 [Channa argus]|uniref:Matrix metalloproteinase-17 n=1 Tax=Channa argus TaxID=215402 RepID=A0A6G1PTH3_CHAAH|nr:Matrix metalloproteinase-17 [Channa argus]
MKMWIIFLCLSYGWMQTSSNAGVTPTLSSAPVTPTEDESIQLVDWLMKYGYLPPSDPSTGQLQAWTAVTNAVRAMQRFAGLKDTGVADEDTVALMNSPRCSLPDQEEPSTSLANQRGRNMKRRRRMAISMWTRRNINWRLHSYPSSSHLSREMVRSLVFYALRVWSEPTPLEFHEVSGPEAADLQVDFLHGYHGDGYPFDGAGGAVGHAFFPSDPARAGGVHLDAEEQWAFRQPVMRPYYQGPAGDPLHYRLGPQDQEQITQLYGEIMCSMKNLGNGVFFGHQLQVWPVKGNSCRLPMLLNFPRSPRYITGPITTTTATTKGLTMWRVNGAGLVSGRGASVGRLWGGLPPDLPYLHAVLERQSDHAIIFISGSQFWLFRDLSLQEGYPQPLSSLRMGVNLDVADDEGEEEKAAAAAAVRQGLVWDPEEGPVWGNIGGTEEVKHEDTWTQLLREGVSGIITDNDGSVSLFKGDSYWKFMFPGSSPENGYPRSSADDWLDCPDSSSSSAGVGDLSLSLSRPEGRQELRERWKNVGGKEEEAEIRMRGHGRDSHQNKQDRDSHTWTQCTCQNGAQGYRTVSFTAALLLGTWTLLAV